MTAPSKFAATKKNPLSFKKVIQAAQEDAATKTTFFTLATLIVTLVYTVIFFFPIKLLPPSQQPLLLIVITFLVAFTINSLRTALEEIFRQLFPELDYNAQEIVRRLNTISYTTLTLDRLTEKLLSELEVHLHIDQSAFVILEPGKSASIRSHGFPRPPNLTPTQIERLIRKSQNQPIIHHKLHQGKTKHLFDELHLQVVLPLTINNTVTSLLLLGHKYTSDTYASKDIKVLESAGQKMAFAIENAKDYELIRQKNQALIDDLKSTNEQFRKANRQLKHDDKLKDELIYIATHELKNPVTAMKGYVSLLLEGQFGKLPDKIKPAVEQINASNQQLIGLLNNLLQIARSEAQHIDIKTHPIPICPTIDEVMTDLKPLADQKGLRLTHFCPNQAVTVMAENERLREVISNLISNAIKYSEKGAIEVNHEIAQDQLVTHVKDEGVGIGQKDQGKIFTRFFRVEEEAAKGIPGTGLGLFIIKELIERMGGKIWFESKPNKGSTFSFSLPLARTYSFRSQ